MSTRISVWAYPWDIADEGAGNALDWLQDAGFDAIDLCPNYHAISTFSPRNHQRSLFYSEQGAVYFPARLERYGRIKPKIYAEPAVVAAYGAVSDAIGPRGMQLNAWIIGMFQPWMARAYPDVAIENAFGHRSYAQTCPSSPDVQEYLATFVADLCEQYGVSGITLENVGHPGFAAGWVCERILIDLSPWTRCLAGLCFCRNCLAAARARGVDAPRLREAVAAELRGRLDASPDEPPAEDLAELVTERCGRDQTFRGYLEAREQTARAMTEGVCRALRDSDVRVAVTGAATGWSAHGLRLADLLESVGAVMFPDPTDDPGEAEAQVALVRRSGRDIQLTVSQSGAAEVRPNRPEFEARVRRIAEIGVDRVMVYNFGLLTPATLRHVGGVLRRTLDA